jgi:two-component system sensor histidine kinase KdpD
VPSHAARCVLVVDDDRDTRRLFRIILEGEGYGCEEAADAATAERVVDEGGVDLALVDVRLGDDDGLALARRLRQRDEHLGVLMVSGLDDPDVTDAAMELGAFGYLLKPVRRGELLLQVANARRRQELERRQRDLVADLERRVAERTAELQGALTRAEEAEAVRSQFVQNLSHELRTPLTVIVASAALLPRTDDEEGRRSISASIEEQTGRLRRLVERLLAVASFDEVFSSEPLEPVALRTLLAVAAGPARSSGRPVEVDVEADGAGREPVVLGSVRRLAAALGHVVDNALRFTPPDSPLRLAASPEHDGWAIRIVDHGPGVPPARRDRLWEPFVQGDGGTDRAHGGLGVGLYLTRRLVEWHRGTVDAEETPGGGLTVILRVPTAPV